MTFTFINKYLTKAEKLIYKNSLIFIFFLYSLCNLFFLTNNFLFWDDWCLTGNSFAEIMEFYKGPGTCPWGVLFMEMIYHVPPFFARWIIFALYFTTTVCLEKILKNLGVKDLTRFIIVLLYTINPVVIAKYALIDAGYYLGQSLFFLASYIIICHNENKKAYYIAIIIFFLSFMTRSLLCFYAVPIGVLFYKNVICDWKGFRISIFAFIKKYYLFLILPFAFYAYIHFCLKPSGLYAEENYNSINVFYLVKNTFNLFFKSITDIYNWLFYTRIKSDSIKYAIIIILIVSFFFDRKDFYLYLASLFIFLFARFPYTAVEKYGAVGGAGASRHFLLTPLPTALLTYLTFIFISKNCGRFIYLFRCCFFKQEEENVSITCIVKNIPKFEFRKGVSIFISLIVTCNFLFINLRVGKNVMEDTIIQEAIIEKYKESDAIRNNTNFSITTNYSYYGQWLQENDLIHYIAFGLFWKAFNDEKRVSYNTKFQNEDVFNWYFDTLGVLPNKYFKIRGMQNKKASHNIYIETNNLLLSRRWFVKTYFMYIFNKKEYYKRIKNCINLVTIALVVDEESDLEEESLDYLFDDAEDVTPL